LNNAGISTIAGKGVHQKCRRYFCRPIKANYCEIPKLSSPFRRRSSTTTYNADEHCLFYGLPAKYDGRKRGQDVIPVRTKDFQSSVKKVCNERKDAWADVIRGRLQYLCDLHVADTVYDQRCSVNFRTGKEIPKQYSSVEPKRAREGRPVDNTRVDAFLKVAKYLEENDDEQITINALIKKMECFLQGTDEEEYSPKYMKAKLLEHFKDKIIITNIKKQPQCCYISANCVINYSRVSQSTKTARL
jgi:hypothetical protein